MLITYKEESPLATEVRRVANKLILSGQERKIKTVMITSSQLGEGKSTIAAYLAIACSKYRNTRVVLVDFDLRRSRVHELFEVRKRRGVADVLSRKHPTKECIKESKYPNLYLVTSGRLSKITISDLLNSPMLTNLFAELRFYFDLVIVDAPPVIPVADPLILSPEIDGALFVIKAGQTQKPVIERALQLLKDARIQTMGAILNNMNHVLPYYYDYDFYDYEYYADTNGNGEAHSAKSKEQSAKGKEQSA